MIIFLIIIAIAIEVIIEASKGDKHGVKSKIILASLITGFFLVPFLINNYLWGGIIYVLIRFAIFDYLYGYRVHSNIFYLGTTSQYDIILKKYNKYLILITKILCLSIGILLYIYAK